MSKKNKFIPYNKGFTSCAFCVHEDCETYKNVMCCVIDPHHAAIYSKACKNYRNREENNE